MSETTLNIRLEELEKTYAFIALNYTLRAAEHLEAWGKSYEELGEREKAEGVRLAAGHLYDLADEVGKKAVVSVGDLTRSATPCARVLLRNPPGACHYRKIRCPGLARALGRENPARDGAVGNSSSTPMPRYPSLTVTPSPPRA